MYTSIYWFLVWVEFIVIYLLSGSLFTLHHLTSNITAYKYDNAILHDLVFQSFFRSKYKAKLVVLIIYL